MVTKGWEEREKGVSVLMGTEILLGMMKKFWVWKHGCHTTLYVFNTTKLYANKWLK